MPLSVARLANWRSALHSAVLSAAGRPFVWGENDCVTFMGDCYLAQTGRDLIAPYRDRYSTAAGALRVIRATGAQDLLELVGRHMAPIERGPAFAQEGDVAMIPTEALEGGVGWACGIILGARIGVLAPTGYGTVDRRQAGYAFRI
jgi:hypothetical protein